MSLKLVVFACLPLLGDAQFVTLTVGTPTLDLDRCLDGFINVTYAFTVPTSNNRPNFSSECDTTERFRELCQWERMCTVHRDFFAGSCPSIDYIQLDYDCYINPTLIVLEEMNREFPVNTAHVFSSPQYPDLARQDTNVKCVLDNIQGSTFSLTKLHAYVSSSQERTVLWIARQANLSGSDIPISSNTTSRFTNFNTLLETPLHSLYITYNNITDARFVLILKANTTVRMCCHQNDSWPVCDEPSERNTKATLAKNADKSSVKLGLILGVVLGGLALVIIAAVLVGVVVRRRKTRGQQKLSGYTAPPQEGSDFPRVDPSSAETPDYYNNSQPYATSADVRDSCDLSAYDKQKGYTLAGPGADTRYSKTSDGVEYSVFGNQPSAAQQTQPVPQPRSLNRPKHSPPQQPVYADPHDHRTATQASAPSEYADPIPKSQRPRPGMGLPSPPQQPSQQAPALETQGSNPSTPRSPTELNAPDKPKRLHQGLVKDRLGKFESQQEQNRTGAAPLPSPTSPGATAPPLGSKQVPHGAERGSVTRWEDNMGLYAASKVV